MDCGNCTEFPNIEIKNLEQKCEYCELHGPPILWTPIENSQKTERFIVKTQLTAGWLIVKTQAV